MRLSLCLNLSHQARQGRGRVNGKDLVSEDKHLGRSDKPSGVIEFVTLYGVRT